MMFERKQAVRLIMTLVVFFGAVLIFTLLVQHNAKARQFSGIIEKISIDSKGYPNILVNGKSYNLGGTGLFFCKKVEKGDSIIKEKDSFLYKLIKKNTNEIILSSQD